VTSYRIIPSIDSPQTFRCPGKSKLGVEVFRAIGLLKRLCNHPILAAKPEVPREEARIFGSIRISSEGADFWGH